MANANVLELETCLDECIAYCATHQKRDFVEFYEPRLLHAKERWYESVEVSDRHYLDWQREFREDRIAWRKLATEYKATQDALRKLNAVGYPDEIVRYWDEDILTAAVEKLVGYLESRKDVISIADERIEALTRGTASAQGEDTAADAALRQFKLQVLFRAEAMGTMTSAIGDFRVAMRRSLGKKSDEYLSIRWPMTVAPDEPVL